MTIDHAATYRDQTLKNLVHRRRLKGILSVLEEHVWLAGRTYADVGCSNGYITATVCERFRPKACCGFDNDADNLEQARKSYPHIEFREINLNEVRTPEARFDVVTSFEVLEHVGDLENALENLILLTAPQQGLLFITAPIEVGWRGTLKFLAKTLLYGYKLDELPPRKTLYLKYLAALVAGGRISRFRDKKSGWGTHFGFDCREIDAYLASRGVHFQAWNDFMTRFYLVRPSGRPGTQEPGSIAWGLQTASSGMQAAWTHRALICALPRLRFRTAAGMPGRVADSGGFGLREQA